MNFFFLPSMHNSSNSYFKAILLTAFTSLVLFGCGGSSDDTQPVPNQIPTVSAGADLQADENTVVSLDASASDTDGSIASISWQQIAGTTVVLSATDTLSLTFTAPDVKPDELLSFTVTATDDDGATASDTLVISVLHINSLPTADAGSNLTTDEVSAISLEGTAGDVDGNIVSYLWQQTGGPTGILNDSDKATAEFITPTIDEDTEVELTLTVTDDEGGTDSQNILVFVSQVENLMTGRFVDSPVQGLTYNTPTRAGITGANGEFHYLVDETVVFGLGDLTFPAVTAAQIITPLELAGVNDINDTFVVNMARLLQTLDQDCNPDNGITIGGEVLLAAADLSIDFSDPDFDVSVANLVNDAAQVQNSCDSLIDPAQAVAHFQATLDILAEQNIPPIGGGLQGKFGIWEGEGQQSSISWTIKITLKAEEQLIEYPSLSCGGFLTLLEETEAQILFRETITFGTGCVDQGFVELTDQSVNELVYRYYWPTTGDPRSDLGAVGSVTKVVE